MTRLMFLKVVFSFILLTFITACGGSSSSTPTKDLNSTKNISKEKIIGYLVDAPIANVNYECDGNREKTDENGTFKCVDLPVKFTIGNIHIGTIEADEMSSDFMVYPQDLVGVSRDNVDDVNVLKLASFLQSLDDDGNISTSINIPDDINFSIEKNLIDMSQDEINDILVSKDITPVTYEDAKKHLVDNMVSNGLLSIEDNSTEPVETPTPAVSSVPTEIPTSNPISDTVSTSSSYSTSSYVYPTPIPNPSVIPTPTTPAVGSTIDEIATPTPTTPAVSLTTDEITTPTPTTPAVTSTTDEITTPTPTIPAVSSTTDENITTSPTPTPVATPTPTTSYTSSSSSSSSTGTSSPTPTPTPSSIVGHLVDSPIYNATYECDDNINKTDENGTFECITLPVSFSIGGIELGTIGDDNMSEDLMIYPQDLVGVDRDNFDDVNVLKIASFLQSLDDDGNISTSINIPDDIDFGIEKSLIEMEIDEVEFILEEKNITPVTITEARIHLVESMVSNGGIETQEFEARADVAPTPTPIPSTTPIADATPTPITTPTPSVIETQEFEVRPYVTPTPRPPVPPTPTPVVSTTTPTPTPTPTPTTVVTVTPTPTPTPTPTSTTILDTTPPAQNATINKLVTDDATPPLSGNLPSGDDDVNTTGYTIKVTIDNSIYSAVNNKNGTWSIADDTISPLSIGKYDINITVTDEAGNSSTTNIFDAIDIDNTAFLIDSAVEGIKYISGAFSGYTDRDGLFKYDKGEGVSFYIGDEDTGIPLGTAVEKVDPYNSNRRIITVFDLAGTSDENNRKVINIGKFLQSLDSDKDVSNGITIDNRTKESIILLGLKDKIDFDVDTEVFSNNPNIYNLFNDLAGHFGEHRGLISTEDTKAHLVAVRDNKLATGDFILEKVSGEKEETVVLTGVFQTIDGVIEGVDYRSGNQFGRTNEKGEFKFEEGKDVRFSIYQLELGATEAKSIITPVNLVPATSYNHPRPRNIIRLLRVFDAIADDNKITIDDAVREALEKYRSQIDLNLPDGKANVDLGIPAGVDEFGSQFEDFEIGKDILDEITKLRG